MKNNISLGSFTPNEVKNLSMSLAIDPNMGNEYQALIGHVKWIFTAMGDDQPKPPVTTPDAPTPEDPVIPPTNPDNRYTSETEYPYTDWEQTVLIPNALVPLLGNLVPLTGVTGFTVLWVIGMVASAWIFALLILPIFKRKKENSRNAAQ